MTLLGTLIYKKLKPELPLWKMGPGSSILCSLFSGSPLTLPAPHGALTPALGSTDPCKPKPLHFTPSHASPTAKKPA